MHTSCCLIEIIHACAVTIGSYLLISLIKLTSLLLNSEPVPKVLNIQITSRWEAMIIGVTHHRWYSTDDTSLRGMHGSEPQQDQPLQSVDLRPVQCALIGTYTRMPAQKNGTRRPVRAASGYGFWHWRDRALSSGHGDLFTFLQSPGSSWMVGPGMGLYTRVRGECFTLFFVTAPYKHRLLQNQQKTMASDTRPSNTLVLAPHQGSSHSTEDFQHPVSSSKDLSTSSKEQPLQSR